MCVRDYMYMCSRACAPRICMCMRVWHSMFICTVEFKYNRRITLSMGPLTIYESQNHASNSIIFGKSATKQIKITTTK